MSQEQIFWSIRKHDENKLAAIYSFSNEQHNVEHNEQQMVGCRDEIALINSEYLGNKAVIKMK